MRACGARSLAHALAIKTVSGGDQVELTASWSFGPPVLQFGEGLAGKVIPNRRHRLGGLMRSVKRRYSMEEFARRGDAIYKKEILPKLTAKAVGKFLAIDIETGKYEMAADERKAGDKLRARLPEAQIWMVRIGYTSPRSFGGRQVRQKLP
jgi:hypothetical protein